MDENVLWRIEGERGHETKTSLGGRVLDDSKPHVIWHLKYLTRISA